MVLGVSGVVGFGGYEALGVGGVGPGWFQASGASGPGRAHLYLVEGLWVGREGKPPSMPGTVGC